jgi:hypothetical protein
MKTFFALLVGIAIGVGIWWYYSNSRGRTDVRTDIQTDVKSAGDKIETAAKSAGDKIQEKLREWKLQPDDIKDDLAKTGRIIRSKTEKAGQAISDATADARTTAAIKGKLVANRDLSALSISVNTTAGVVTLSGTVNSPEDIGKAMLVAMETDGVTQVVSTLQVTMKSGKTTGA